MRNPGGGRHDDLYCSSIVALDARSGEPAWHFQTTPGDDWDQDADATLVQADLEIGGRVRHALLQASKNGFFYVFDRKTGELISGKPFTYINWASGLDAKGRPDRHRGGRLQQEAAADLPVHQWRALLGTDVVQRPNAPGVHPGQ